MPAIKKKPSKQAKKKTVKKRVNLLNDLTAKEWLPETISVWIQRGLGKGHDHAKIEREHPAPFSFQDVARLIRFFTKKGELVLDPFVGVGSTLKAAALEGRLGIGFELNKRYASLARRRLSVEVGDEFLEVSPQEVRTGDSRELIAEVPDSVVSLVVTSPPYWNILQKVDHKATQDRLNEGLDTQYSDNDTDFGNIDDYDYFLTSLADLLGETHRCLKKKGHLCVVVGDFRHKSKYYMFHSDIASAMETRGFQLKGITILYQRHKRIFPYGYPYSFVPNLHHQYIVILEKV